MYELLSNVIYNLLNLFLEPISVMSLQAAAHSSSALNITWDLPRYPNGPLSHYVIFYQEANTPQTGTIITSQYTMISERVYHPQVAK